MEYVHLPNTDLRVSRVAMGCWGLSGDATWGPLDEGEAIAAVHAALDAGIQFFDTAELYGDGVSEERLGKAVRGRRREAIIASKFNPEHARAEQVTAACHRTLKRLGTDYLDLYQIHWPSRTVPLEETWAAMETLQKQGKVRALGVCNFGVGDLGALLRLGRPAADQLPYSLLNRAVEFAILPRCRAEGIGVLCYSPLQLGLLSGGFRTADEVPEGRARTRHFSSHRPGTRHGEPGCEEETFAAIDAIRQVSHELDRPMAELAIAWLLAQPAVSCVLVGIRTAQQARQNAALDPSLDGATVARLAQITEAVKQALGPNPDAWEPACRSRFR